MRASGFTLTELLVALFIFALIAGASSGLLNLAFATESTINDQIDAQASLGTTRSLIKADMAQLVSRPTRGRFGTQDPAGLVGGIATENAQILIRFARLGWANPGGRQARGRTQAVSYVLEDGTLWRQTPMKTDPAPDTPIRRRALFTGVRQAEMDFFALGQWQAGWQTGDLSSATLPEAMRLTLDFASGERLVQLFLVRGTPL